MIAERDSRAAAIARDFPILGYPTSRGKRLAYLDSAASSQKPQAVIDALVHYYTHDNANIHRGVYELAERATEAFEGARAKVARFINAAEPAEVVWTRNTTEAINLVSFSWGLQNLGPGDAILTSQLEHHSNLVPWQLLAAKTGATLRFIEVDASGMHRLDDLDAKLRGAKLVALSHVSNAMPPFLTGGDMIKEVRYESATFNELPWKFEAGTSNIADAVALGAAVDYLDSVGMDWVAAHERRLTAYALARLAPFQARGLALYGPADQAHRSGVISFNFADIHAHDLASILDTEGVCVRAGHHCTMPLMEKMGWPATARASFYLYNTEEDVDQLAGALERAATIFGVA
jgi:cysteine desulfurase/selenocysteine lyase